MTTDPTPQCPGEGACDDEGCEGPCPRCKACTWNNNACGDSECCGANYDYCSQCDWESYFGDS